MRTIKLSILIMLVVVANVVAQNYPVANPKTRVTDQANVLSDAEEKAIFELMYSWEDKYHTGVEYGVATIESVEGYDKTDYATQLFKKWKIGKAGANNGVLIALFPNDRGARIITGYGVEGILPDLICSRIAKEAFNKEDMEAKKYANAILKALTKLHDVVGTMSEDERKTWIEQKAQAERLASEKASAEFWDGVATFFSWVLGLGLLVGAFILLWNMAEKRRRAFAENEEIRTKVEALVNDINNFNLNLYLKYNRVVKLADLKFQIENIVKIKKFWTSDVIEQTRILIDSHKNLSDSYKEVVNALNKMKAIDNITANIKSSEISKLSDSPYIKSFLKKVDEMDSLELDDNLDWAYKTLEVELSRVKTVLETKKNINTQIDEILSSEIVKYNTHPEVQPFLDAISKMKDLEINQHLTSKQQWLNEKRSTIERDLRLRKELIGKKIDFSSFQPELDEAAKITKLLKLNATSNLAKFSPQYLNEATKLYSVFDSLRNGNIDSNWNEIKSTWSKTIEAISAHKAEIERVNEIHEKYKEAVKQIPVLNTSILSNINIVPTKLNKNGVSGQTKSLYTKFVEKWNNMNASFNGLSTLEVLALYALLTEMYNQLNSITNSAVKENQNYEDELRRERERKEREERERIRRKREEEDRRRRNSYSNSSYGYGGYGSSNSGSTNSGFDGFGGGDSGGGGGGGSDW